MVRALILATAAAAIANLADPAWRVRERASACLYHLAPFVVPELLAAEKDENVERKRRVSFTLRLYYRDNADRLSRLLTDLPPISEYGRLVWKADHPWDVWGLMLECRAEAYRTLGRDMPIADPWDDHQRGYYGFTDPEDVQREATRILCRPWIAQRRDLGPLLQAMKGE